MNFREFLALTADDDREFLSSNDKTKLHETICAMSNGLGGWIILDDVFDYETADLKIQEKYFSSKADFQVYEFNNDTEMQNSAFNDENSNAKKYFVLKVEPLIWYNKPMHFKNLVYRRFEGENFISGKKSNAKITSDAMNFPFDDTPVNDKSLNTRSLNQFLSFLKNLFPRNQNLEILKKSFIYSGNFLTEAGFLMLGTDSVNVKMQLFHDKKVITLEAHNLWNAYFHLLPKIAVSSLDYDCKNALSEMFLNSLIHSDYRVKNEINIIINKDAQSNPKITIQNPCCILRPNRNFRLMKIFKLLGVSKNESHGLSVIKKYDENFRLELDMLNFTVTTSIELREQTEIPKLPEVVIL